MPFIPKFPPGCAHLDLKEVERVLVRHRANINEAARELGVSRTDLRKLTWHSPKILEEALIWCGVYVNRCNGLLIEALHSKSRRRREWASDKILSSSMAYGCLFARAPSVRRRLGVYTGQARVEWEAAAELELERAAGLEGDRRREQEGEEIVIDVEPSVDLRTALPAPTGSLWPAWISAAFARRMAGASLGRWHLSNGQRLCPGLSRPMRPGRSVRRRRRLGSVSLGRAADFGDDLRLQFTV